MQKIDVQELAIVVAVREFDPTLVTPDFLRQTRIVPADWQVIGEPVRSFQGSQINYQAGVSVIAQPQRISFAELAADKSPDTLAIPRLTTGFSQLLSNLDYIGVGINFRGFVDFGEDPNRAREFIFQNILAAGSWQKIGTTPVQAGINLGYTFDDRRLNLTINDALLQVPEKPASSVVLFSGNFDYDLGANASASDRLLRLREIVNGWQKDLDTYQDVVSKFILSQSVIPFPSSVNQV
jgi:hypothetical protein